MTTQSASKLDKKQQLLEAAIELFAQQGFWNSSTAAIAKHAKVATGTLFNYFATKDALIDEVYLTIKHEMMAAINTGMPAPDEGKKVVEHIWFQYINWSIQHSVRHDLLNQLKLSDLVSNQAKDSVNQEFKASVELFEQLFKQGIFKQFEFSYFFDILLSQMEACANYAKQNQLKDMALAQHLTQGFDAFWSGVGR